ncbi:ABC transporter [Cyathus striatus]|nr:ABC transporter [Cyathus striatus]
MSKSKKWRHRVPFLAQKDTPPPNTSLDDAALIPEATAGFFSILTFEWLSPLLSLGYRRPLEAPDLYKLPADRGAAYIADQINASYDRRRVAADEYNARLASGQVKPPLSKTILWSFTRGKREDKEAKWRQGEGKKQPSLTWALNDSVKWWFWSGGVLKVIADTAQVTSPLLVKAIIKFAQDSYAGHRLGTNPHRLTFALLALQIIASLCTHHFFYRSTSTGVLLRGGLITAIYTRSLKLTSRARSTLTNGKLVNHISTDVSRIDFCAGFFHMAWSAPIQLTICLILLILNLGPSALAGFGFFVIRLFTLRKKSMAWTDRRAKLLQELLFFAWEVPFLDRIFDYRRKEMGYIRSLLLIRSANNAVAMSMPVLASVISFITFSASGHELQPDVIFASLTLFTLLRLPLMFLPVSFSAIADAQNAIGRLRDVRQEGETRPRRAVAKSKAKEQEAKDKRQKEIDEKAKSDEESVFKINEATISIPRGKLVAIVGPVGSGKTSLLQGVIGEMRKTSGSINLGESAWIQNATIRENICFGRPFEEDRYWKAVHDSCLGPDLEMLPNGDLTEVGEKGISLSGGQKQRLNICRTIYCDTDIQIFDDPLSALDAHVGKAVFQNVLQNSLSGKTRILVTHALHSSQRGTYAELMSNGHEFSRFITEFGSKEEENKVEQEEEGIEESTSKSEPSDDDDDKRDQKLKKAVAGQALMQTEERNTGAISTEVYKTYIKAGRGKMVLPFLFFSLVLIQGATVLSSYWLVYWQERKWNQPEGFYMGIYAGLGVSQAIAAFLMGSTFSMLTYFASQRLHRNAIERVMHAPMSFFETTPLGRIMNRFSKDIDTIDNMLGDSLRMFAGTTSSILGAIILISIVLPWFLIGVFVILLGYIYAANFYRASARELKRLDAVLRSSLYSHFSESLSGLATIRAYGETGRFRADNEKRVDVENRAYWLTVTNQRWLGIRLDFLGSLLTFVVAILTVGTRFTISPAQTGLVLSYILSVQQAFGWLVRQSAEVENNMNSVERIVHYSTQIEQEAPHQIADKKPVASWPSEGAVQLNDIVLRYRPELPPVLKGITMSVRAGEKIGIVGRTGAGKSSIMTALYRIVELSSGSISIDGVDISKIGLEDLRSKLAIIPQDPLTCFITVSGTLRSNLDPFNQHDDATLWDALKRSYLVENRIADPMNRFTLDTVIEDERSLVSLARALVKNSKVIILDEATASVDYETDRNIQDTIAYEFRDRTILCIAHRLRTIISYDRICVLDAGQVAEFDTPERLYNNSDGYLGECVNVPPSR